MNNQSKLSNIKTSINKEIDRLTKEIAILHAYNNLLSDIEKSEDSLADQE